jgi:amphi-Trp domain-containing protein
VKRPTLVYEAQTPGRLLFCKEEHAKEIEPLLPLLSSRIQVLIHQAQCTPRFVVRPCKARKEEFLMKQPQALQRSLQKPKKDPLLKQRLPKASTHLAADFLCFLVEGLRNGSFTLRAGEQSILLTVSSVLELSVRLQRKSKSRACVKEQLKLELVWKERERAFSPSNEADDCCRSAVAALERAPFGLSLQELGQALRMPWGRLTWTVRKLMATGRVVRVKKRYRLV